MVKERIVNVSKELIEKFASRFDVKMLLLFGSAANMRKPAEDIDIAVLLSDTKRVECENNINLFIGFSNDLAKVLGVSSDILDITFISSKTPPLLLYYIARDGKLVFGNRSVFNELRLKAMRVFFDTAKFRSALDHYLKEKLHA